MGAHEEDREAWERLYASNGRQWRGSADISFVQITPGERVLELGCGNGKTARALADAGAEVTGVDFSPSAIAECKKLLGDRAGFVEADIRELPFGDSSFDKVVAFHVLEHLPDEDVPDAIKEIHRVLIPHGLLCLRLFAEGDLRSGGKKEDVRNGIRYRYWSPEDVVSYFRDEWELVSLNEVETPTRFAGPRRRLEAVIRRD
ncbi:MAG: class I SAM-dependent methyltransferase [Methanomethylophilus sp.]|jgi:ubiquinone/menaquinone biosynthesis C-methylase UbiE